MDEPTGRGDTASATETARDSSNQPFAPANEYREDIHDFVIRLQVACRTYLCKHNTTSFTSDTRLSHVSSAPSLAYLTREARYARSEAALRVALSRCDTEPSPLELQVRVMEKGLHSWNLRAGRGYERVKKAENALAAARQDQEDSKASRSSLSELQREKWMGIKERDEALAMVENIKALITELNADIKGGLKSSSRTNLAESLPPRAPDTKSESASLNDTASKKAAILFSGKFPPPYLDSLPRSRRSVEPLRLPLRQPQLTTTGRQRSVTLRSEPGSAAPSTSSIAQSSTPPPATPNDFGAALIHTPLPLRSAVQLLAEKEGSNALEGRLSHLKLPSYVDALLEEFSEDRIGGQNLDLGTILRPLPTFSPSSTNPALTTPVLSTGISSPLSRTPNSKSRSRGLLRRPFIGSTSPSPLPKSPPRSKENLDPSLTPRDPNIESAAAFEKLLQTFSNVSASALPSDTSLASPLSGPFVARKKHMKNPGRMENMMQSMKKGVKKVSRLGD